MKEGKLKFEDLSRGKITHEFGLAFLITCVEQAKEFKRHEESDEPLKLLKNLFFECDVSAYSTALNHILKSVTARISKLKQEIDETRLNMGDNLSSEAIQGITQMGNDRRDFLAFSQIIVLFVTPIDFSEQWEGFLPLSCLEMVVAGCKTFSGQDSFDFEELFQDAVQLYMRKVLSMDIEAGS